MYECFHCGCKAVVWDSDFSFDDFGYEGEGIVHVCHCSHCGAEIQYKVSIPDGEKNDEKD
jgi:hypothetical protein